MTNFTLTEPIRTGRLINQARAGLGLSLRAAASESKVSLQTWSLVELGKQPTLRAVTAAKIEKMFGWSVGSIEQMDISGEPPLVVATSPNKDLLQRIEELEVEVALLSALLKP